jgi:hypothetical protein
VILEVAIAVAAAGAALGALRAMRRRPPSAELTDALAAARPRRTGLSTGDVLAIPGEELVLGGVVTLDDGGSVLTAFALVGAARDRWLVQLDRDGNDLALTTESSELVGEIPAALPIGGRTLALEKRGVARITATGEGVPAIDGARAPYVVLAERGGRVAIVIDPANGSRLALVGERIDPRVVDRLRVASALTR